MQDTAIYSSTCLNADLYYNTACLHASWILSLIQAGEMKEFPRFPVLSSGLATSWSTINGCARVPQFMFKTLSASSAEFCRLSRSNDDVQNCLSVSIICYVQRENN